MTLTDEMKEAVDIISNTRNNVFITGKAGTGKTTLLKYLIENVKKDFIVTAPTGVAAINAGGATLHSVFNIPFEPYIPMNEIKMNMNKNKIDVIFSLDVLIIDEVSMVRPDIIDYIDKKMQICRGNKCPFGGAQIVMIGDLFQLPAVITKSEENVLRRYYNGMYFFNAIAFQKKGFNIIELSHVFRQSDEKFISLLNKIRDYSVSEDELDALAELRDKKESSNFNSKKIHICTHRDIVDEINTTMLGEHTHSYKALLSGKFKETSLLCNEELKLRIGARVMILVNGKNQEYCNGTLGVVTELNDFFISITTDDEREVMLGRNEWFDHSYVVKDGKIEKVKNGSCKQFPVTLAWAITVHKSQGLTFDNVVLHVDRSFTPGQVYVALSRCRTMEGIVSDSYITKRHIIANEELLNFERKYKNNRYTYGTMSLL